MAYKGTIYTEEELGLSGFWDDVSKWTGKAADVVVAARGGGSSGGGGGITPGGPGFQPSFMQKYGAMIAVGGGASILLYLVLRKKK